MGKRSVGACVWLAFGMLVLVIMGPKEIWIGLGVIGAIAFTAYLVIKYLSQKEKRDAYRNEPTLAELIAKSEPQQSLHRPEPRPSGMHRIPPERPPVKHPGQSPAWNTTRQATIDANRERAQVLRDRFPPIPPRTNEQISAPAYPTPPTSPPPRTPQNSTPPADTPSRSQTTKLPDQSAEWNAMRQTAIDAIHERAQALRDRFPPIPPRTNEISAPVEPAAPPITLQPPAPPRVSERASTPHSPPAPPSSASTAEAPTLNPERTPKDFTRVLQGSPEPERMYSATGITKPPLTHALPAAPAGFGEGRWIPPGESIEVAGVNLPGGMLYVGGRLKALNGSTDPCLISGQYNVARVGNYRARQMGYWPSYAEASPEERRAYLNWLSEGRSHPDCDIGYVFLFFYGLERRIIADSRDDPTARNDWPAIIIELRRLLAIYGEKSGSFNRYVGELLGWIELDGKSSQLYKQPIPDFPKTYDLPPYLRLALGQAAVDHAPLPVHIALAWLRLSPECHLRTAATRCPNEFERLFAQRYHEVLGPGLVLPKNRTKLKFVYQAASAGLRGANVTMSFGDIPDVTALTAPIRKLMEIANQCTDELGSYSRLVGREPGAAETLEGLLLLPVTLWPAATQAKLRALSAQMREGRLSLPLKELLDVLGSANQAVNRDRIRGLARALEEAEIGLEPNVLGGARAPGEKDTIVLFAQPLMDSGVGSRTEYQTAALTLQLASAVAQADGVFDDREVAHLRAEIEGWTHLTLAERRRLHAHLQWLRTSPMNLTKLKKKLEPLPTEARETLAAFMATLAQADGVVSPDEVKFLEKVYKALDVEPRRVFSDIHRAGSGGTPVSPVQTEKQGFHLDAGRIAALQEDTVRVSALLSKIFAEETDSTPAPAAPAPEPELVEGEVNAPLGLDQDHSALLRLLLSRPEWTRAELVDAAADLDLMLDGAMEQINEAAFETFDEPLFEGEDPISVNTQLLEKIEA
ncbi:TerB N-terminal domain-containing protein [Rhodanobacter sp. 115]|uniref:tellurite resistance TerB family protein n=1 Tax=Rhodanobacter sp. FW021-MT20 TaxID=1162282 RepID=UPI000318FD82|nr:TerB N-terminal domain-containing protein [Rhodanobacter sp. 115]